MTSVVPAHHMPLILGTALTGYQAAFATIYRQALIEAKDAQTALDKHERNQPAHKREYLFDDAWLAWDSTRSKLFNEYIDALNHLWDIKELVEEAMRKGNES